MTHDSRSRRNVLSIWPVKRTLYFSSSCANLLIDPRRHELLLSAGSGSFKVPCSVRSEMPTLATFPCFSNC